VSVTAPKGFVAAGTACGIKTSGDPDLALVATADGAPVPAAGVFTRNRAPAAAVQVSRAHLAESGGRAAAVVLSSGNANAATGAEGVASAQRMCVLVGEELGVAGSDVLVCQTGLIGVPLPMAPLETGIPSLVATRADGRAAAERAARAIMTTDTVPKQTEVQAGDFTVGGMAKGAAMLAPDMATMLAVLTTDAVCTPEELAVALRDAVAGTFNLLSVDGSTSTNDTVIALASGLSGTTPSGAELTGALAEACGELATLMASDAEGATKVVSVVVSGAATDADARRAARRVAESLLVKCSFNGEDPYWGRVVSELGSAGVAFDPDLVEVSYGDVVVCRGGIAALHDDSALRARMHAPAIELRCDLGLGSGRAIVLGTDLGHGYIDENRTTS
jgi:glutamate N-acetyltransferase/amino-acid N-acetyltransferase